MSHEVALGALTDVPALARAQHVAGVVPVHGRDADRLDDRELVLRARRGDEWAHDMIFRRYASRVASVAQRLLRDPAEVDDIVQETFLIAFEKLGHLVQPAALRGWLLQIAVSRVHRRFRRRRWTRLWSSDEIEARLAEQAAEGLPQEVRAELALIDRALVEMPLELRTPWVLRHVLGYELADVATACQCSLATTKRRLADAAGIVADRVRGGR